MNQRSIPMVDLALYKHGNQQEKSAFVGQLGKAFHEIGFVAVKNHGVPLELVDEFYSEAKRFFAQSVETKRKYEVAGLAGQRGYTSFGKEHAKQSDVPDLKEFFQIGQEVSDQNRSNSAYAVDVQTQETPRFTQFGRELYQTFERSGAELLRAIATHLELDVDYFDKKIEAGSSILRAIHYPPITSEPDSAIRAEQHEDINLITLLFGASVGGLQLQNMDGEWLPIMPEENEIVINVGDMLQRLTNNYLKSTTHRVVNPPKEEWHFPRLSIPFFLHPKGSMDLTCLDQCVNAQNPLAYESISAGEYLDERLREIGLKK